MERLRHFVKPLNEQIRGSLRWAQDYWMNIRKDERYAIVGAMTGTAVALVLPLSIPLNIAWILGGVWMGYYCAFKVRS